MTSDEGKLAQGRGEEREGDPAPLPGPVQEAMRAFQAGDYRRVRQLLPGIEKLDDPESRQAVGDLRRAIGIDPAMAVALLLSAALFIAVACVYVGLR